MTPLLRRSWPVALMAAGGVVLVAIAAWVGLHPNHPPARAEPVTTQIISPQDFPSPSPSPVEALGQGWRIKIAALGVDLPIVEGDGYNAPLFEAVRYPFLALPGGGSRSMIYAHARPGMFGPLFHGTVGQQIVIERPGAAPLHYVVDEYYGHWPSTDLRWLQPASGEELILVTCTTYNVNDPRIVVVARPVQG